MRQYIFVWMMWSLGVNRIKLHATFWKTYKQLGLVFHINAMNFKWNKTKYTITTILHYSPQAWNNTYILRIHHTYETYSEWSTLQHGWFNKVYWKLFISQRLCVIFRYRDFSELNGIRYVATTSSFLSISGFYPLRSLGIAHVWSSFRNFLIIRLDRKWPEPPIRASLEPGMLWDSNKPY